MRSPSAFSKINGSFKAFFSDSWNSLCPHSLCMHVIAALFLCLTLIFLCWFLSLSGRWLEFGSSSKWTFVLQFAYPKSPDDLNNQIHGRMHVLYSVFFLAAFDFEFLDLVLIHLKNYHQQTIHLSFSYCWFHSIHICSIKQ